MSTPRPTPRRLADIVAAAQRCAEFVAGMEYADFTADPKTASAVIWQLCVIGEAANQVSPATRQEGGEIPWRRIVDMRNKLIHDYYDIKLEDVWDTVQDDLPPLIASIQRLQGGRGDGAG